MGSVNITFAICNITVCTTGTSVTVDMTTFHTGMQACFKCNLYQLLISYCHETGQHHMQGAGMFYMHRVPTVH